MTVIPFPQQQGFTLAELLIVLLILGVLMTLMSGTFFRMISSSKVRTDASTLNAEVQRIRVEAQRSSSDTSLKWTTNTGNLQLTSGGQTRTVTLPDTTITCIEVSPVPCPSSNTLTFLAPTGEASTGLILKLSPTSGAGTPLYFKVTGLIGKTGIYESY